jgi:hypothetical protein
MPKNARYTEGSSKFVFPPAFFVFSTYASSSKNKLKTMNSLNSHACRGVLFLLVAIPLFLQAQVQNVVVSVKGGRYNAPFTMTLSTPTPNASIRYTFDGNEPDSLNSPQYTGPFYIDKTSTLRAKAFVTGQVSSKITTHTYLFNMPHSFPIVAVTFKPNDFFSPATGIYPNYATKIEVPAHVELYENGNNTAVIDQDVATEIQGSASAQLPQKSLEFKAKAAFGPTSIPYKIFPDLPYTSYKRLVVRNSGQDWGITMFRDDYVSSLHADMSDLGSILKKPEIYSAAYRPSVVYYNGEYWGVHSMKERMKATFVEQHFNLKATEYDMVENEMETITGDSTVWLNFQSYLNSGVNFANDANYAVLTSRIDMQNFMDIMAFNVFVDHQDWPANNNRRFLPKAAGSKWKWISFDYDFSVGLFQATGGFNTGDPSPNALRRLLDPNFLFFNNGAWSTVLFRKCWENAQFRRDFVNRLSDMMNTILKPSRMNQRVTNFKNLYADELIRHANRWGNPNADKLTENVDKIKYFNDNRPAYVYAQVDELTPDVFGTAFVTLNVSPVGAGSLQFSTLNLSAANLPFSGTYFAGNDIPVVATPAAGYVFVGWSDPSLPQVNSVNVRLSGSRNLTAVFQKIPTASDCKTYKGVDVVNLCGCAQNQFSPYSIRIEPLAGSADCRGTLIQMGDGNASFERKANGEASFKGTFRTNTWQLITLNVTLTGGTATPPSGAPVKSFCMANQPVTDWYYYAGMTGTYQEGTNGPLSITLENTPFQVGTGASQQLVNDLGVSMRFRINNDPTRIGSLNVKLTNETTITCGGGGVTGTPSQDIELGISSTIAAYAKYTTSVFTVTAKNLSATAFQNVVIKFPNPVGTNTGGTPVATLGSWREWQNGVRIYEWQIPNFPANTTATLNLPLYFLDNATNSTTFTANLTGSTPTDGNTANNQASMTLNLALAPTTQRLAALNPQKPTPLMPVVVRRISPNPTNGDVFVDVESWSDMEVTFDVSNALGELVKSEKVTLKKGTNKVYLDANALQSGVYYLVPRLKVAHNVPTKFVKM